MIEYKKVTIHGVLAELAYLKLESKDFKNALGGKGDYRNFDDLAYFIQNDTGHSDINPSHQVLMLETLKKYAIIDFESYDGFLQCDFQGMLLKEIATQNYVIAFRGTAGLVDIVVDVGIANANYNHNFQLKEAKNFVNTMLKKYTISKSNLTLTGHSLGGILVQEIGATQKIKGFSYNALGADELVKFSSSSLSVRGMLERTADKLGVDYNKEALAFGKEHILNISYKECSKLISDPLSTLGTDLNCSDFFSPVLSLYGEGKCLTAHSIVSLNDSILEQNKTLRHFKECDLNLLNEVYGITGYKQTKDIFNALKITEYPMHSLRLVPMHDKEISEYKLHDPSMHYALEHFNAFVVEGELDAYRDIDIYKYDKSTLNKRAEKYYHALRKKNNHSVLWGKSY